MPVPYPAWNVVYGEIPAASKWSQLGANDDALAAGTGISDDAIINRHLANAIVKAENIDFTSFNAKYAGGLTEYTPANLVGYASTTQRVGHYFVIGKIVFLKYFFSGQSNSGNLEFDLPVGFPAKNLGGLSAEANTGLIINNGSVVTQGQRTYVDPATNAQKVVVNYGFTGSGTKVARGQFFYETT